MSNMEQRQLTIGRASKSLPVFVFGGCIFGLLLGVIFGNIPYGVAAGFALSLVLWLASNRNTKRAPDPGADA